MSDDKEKAENEVQIEAIKQAVSTALGFLDEESGKAYDHNRSQEWIKRICEFTLTKLVELKKPYKYVISCVIANKTGAGLHICSSAFYGQNDGCYTHTLELANARLHAVVTVCWVLL